MIAFALVERLLDGVRSHEGLDDIAHDSRHRHRSHEILACLSKGFALGRICRDCKKFIGRLQSGRPQRDPQQGHATGEVVTVMAAFGPVERDFS